MSKQPLAVLAHISVFKIELNTEAHRNDAVNKQATRSAKRLCPQDKQIKFGRTEPKTDTFYEFTRL